MKKIVLMAVMALASMSAFAQAAPGTFTLQPKMSFNVADMSGKNWISDPRLGVAAGVEGEYQITDMFSMSLGAMYSMQGSKVLNDYDYGDYTIKMDYINVPLLANVYFVRNLAVKTGVQFGFLVNDNLSDVPKKFDVSIPIGVSYEYRGFVFDLRYNWGLTDLFDDYDYADLKNSVFQFSLGYKFAL